MTLAAAKLSAMVREHGPAHPDALAAAKAVLAACRGITANIDGDWLDNGLENSGHQVWRLDARAGAGG
ncbi:hypothetical protein [Elioraea rosea]|uniref:hypothetical protein n=1 Tax=Elioraea rosea TaxID=2492390 RepID=UPI001182054C|nr:hypothetical protein [Elioraea rosea]